MNAPLQKGRLGRGLASLIGDAPQTSGDAPAAIAGQREAAIDLLRGSSFNPRRTFDDSQLAELAESIRAKGLVQPIVVRPDKKRADGFEIVAGERRWRAAQKAGLHTVPVVIRDLDDKEALELAIIENVQRSDLNAIEEANGYRELIERFRYSQEQLSDIIGKSRSHVANTLRLLKLPAPVQVFLKKGKLSAGHARALVGRKDAEALAKQIIDDDLTVRAAESLVAKADGKSKGATSKVRPKDADTLAFEKELSDVLGLKVEIKRGSGESGNLIIKYGNFDQLDYIRMRLSSTPDGN